MGASSARAAQVARYVVAQKLTQSASTAVVSATVNADTRFISFVCETSGGYFLVSSAGTAAQNTDHRFSVGERVELIVLPGEKISMLLDVNTDVFISELA